MKDAASMTATDCWNHIGVRGDRSCDKLAGHIHCRNCNVYAANAQTVMQRPLPPGYQQEWAEYFARPESEHKELDRTALVFRIAGEWLALPASLAVTIAESAQPHKVPHRSGGVLAGIVSVKGKIYPCMSLARLLSIHDEQPALPPGKRVYPRLLVVELARHVFALPVDDMHGIHRHAAADMQAVPSTANKSIHRYFTGVLGIGEMLVGCLDAELVGHKLAGALK